VFDLFSLLMQVEIENLTMEERRLDEQIRFACLASEDSSLLHNNYSVCLLSIKSLIIFLLLQGDARKAAGS
jgi:hypothetical protein